MQEIFMPPFEDIDDDGNYIGSDPLFLIKKEYNDINDKYESLYKSKRSLSKKLIKILDNEQDIKERKVIIDLIFSGEVEEDHEHFFRKTYL